MNSSQSQTCSAFAGSNLLASGELAQVAVAAKAALDGGESASILIFDDVTSQLVEVDFRGTATDVAQRLAASTVAEPALEPVAQANDEPARGRGRPKLGVVPREVTLLPRHWEWLNAQPGGASVALRKLVEAARHANEGKDRQRKAQEACYRFMAAMAGDQPGFEEASRALFAGDTVQWASQIASWPTDIRNHADKLAGAAFA